METGTMVREKDSSQNNRDGGDGSNPEDLIKLLKSFYRPEQNEMQNFDDFFGSIEKKLEEQSPVNKIIQTNIELEEDYKIRQSRLEESINRLENNLKSSQSFTKKNSNKLKKILIGIGVIIVIGITLAMNIRLVTKSPIAALRSSSKLSLTSSQLKFFGTRKPCSERFRDKSIY